MKTFLKRFAEKKTKPGLHKRFEIETKVGSVRVFSMLNPGLHESRVALLKMHSDIQTVNQKSKVPLDHKLLYDMDDETLKKHYSSIIVSIAYLKDEPIGFLLSPILHSEKNTLVHAGLVVIAKNPGCDIMTLTGIHTVILGYRAFGSHYVSNISSTPSIVEGFSNFASAVWPAPDMNQKRPPKGYKAVAEKLVNEYVLNFFPNPESVRFDCKRFVLSSGSEAMGFNTKFHQLSLAKTFKFNQFCSIMLDYSKEEDFLQIGKADKKAFVKALVGRRLLIKTIKKQLKERKAA